jgi:Flp pilus assembly protein TadD
VASRTDALERLLESRPDDTRLLFGLALEYLRDQRLEDGVEVLRRYLERTDDEGNAWGRLGEALLRLDRTDEAREAFARGAEAALRHGHPSMADEFEAAMEDLT